MLVEVLGSCIRVLNQRRQRRYMGGAEEGVGVEVAGAEEDVIYGGLDVVVCEAD